MWVRRVLLFIGIGVFTILAGGFVMGWVSAGGTPPGLTEEGELAPCGKARNCVSSQEQTKMYSFIDPLPRVEADVLKAAMAEMGATLVREDGPYLAFTATSAFFRYVDDVEFLLTEDAVHVRSASRVGRSDLGANRKRVETLRQMLEAG